MLNNIQSGIYAITPTSLRADELLNAVEDTLSSGIEIIQYRFDDCINFDDATKVAGPRFVVLKDKLAQIHRALIQLMLDEAMKNNYQECYVPHIVNSNSLFESSTPSAMLVPFSTTSPWEFLFKEKRINRHCILYTSYAADERYSVDLGGIRIIKK